MEIVKDVVIDYTPSDSVEMQGTYEKTKVWRNQGYCVQENRNGYWVLVKHAKVMVTLTNSYCTKTFDVKKEMLEHYNRRRFTKNLLDKFQDDIDNGKIIFKMNEDGTAYIME